MRSHRMCLVCTFAALWLVPTFARANGVEVEAGYARGLSSAEYYVPGPGLRVGLALNQRLTLLAGVSASGDFGFQDRSNSGLGVPVELKWYLRDPKKGSVVPTLRAGVGYFRAKRRLDYRIDGEARPVVDETHDGVTAVTMLGLAFWPHEQFALLAEGGPYYSYMRTRERLPEQAHRDDGHYLEVVWRLSFVYRM